jgi:ubiquinone/menaquinone biosynthesis C-methylase UbiE
VVKHHTCDVCAKNEWRELPEPGINRSVTTTGKIVERTLAKSLCNSCGLVRRGRDTFLGLGEYYEEEYAPYFERPGTEKFHRRRYQCLVDWMSTYMPESFVFSRALDVGCGQGWMMEAMNGRFSSVEFVGVEPSVHNAEIAEGKGFHVLRGKLEELENMSDYDLVYSNNVLQHVNDVAGFLHSLKSIVSDTGAIIVTCPDGSRPSIDLLWADHNYSFLPQNLVRLGQTLGFETVYVTQSQDNPSIPPSQLLLLTNNAVFHQHLSELGRKAMSDNGLDNAALTRMFREKSEYLGAFSKLDDYLTKEIAGYSRVYNFGASFWTSIVATYCPHYWGRVQSCLVDADEGLTEFMNRPVTQYDAIDHSSDAVVVLGIAPISHGGLAGRLGAGGPVVRWDHLFKH